MMKVSVNSLCLLMVFFFAHPSSSKELDSSGDFNYPPGDPRWCLLKNKMIRFEVLPGIGWDNLRNLDAGMVVQYNYSLCRTTDDGRFLIPDNVNTIPLKASSVQTYAELIDHWTNYSSTTSHSINVDASASLPKFSISGKFSADFEHVKSKQIEDKSMTTRVQIRYVRYTAKLQPDSPLTPGFKRRLLHIARHLELNRTAHARYESQLLVRDFGTHVVTSVDAGASIAQIDQIKSSFVLQQEEQKSKILAAASASFFGVVHIGTQYSYFNDKKFADEYRQSRTDSFVKAFGGPLLVNSNHTVTDWSKEVDQDLVAVDRSGDPLFFLITAQTLPELPESILYELSETVRAAIDLYYEYNTYRGCTDRDSPNFSFVANMDDGTCKAAATNMTFGGVYQTCDMQPGSSAGDLCGNLRQKNPKTGQYSCPDGYEPVLLHKGQLSKAFSQHECHSCWLFFKCCRDNYYHSAGVYSSYWCAARGPVHQESGYLFGGLYTNVVNNPLTGGKSCPDYFFPLKLGRDLKVCLSDDYELGFKFSVPFAGFISCSAGNPLSMEATPKSTNKLKNSKYNSLLGFYQQSGPAGWPKHCPKGYSQHLATMMEGCTVNYCVKSGSLSGVALPTVRRPPYFLPPMLAPTSDNVVVFNAETNEWLKNEKAKKFSEQHGGGGSVPSSGGSGELSAGAAAGISVVATLACVAVTTIAISVFRRRRANQRKLYREGEERLMPSHGDYGAVSGDTASSANVQV